jgi:hypothetical protein
MDLGRSSGSGAVSKTAAAGFGTSAARSKQLDNLRP